MQMASSMRCGNPFTDAPLLPTSVSAVSSLLTPPSLVQDSWFRPDARFCLFSDDFEPSSH